MVPGSTLIYGSSSAMLTLSPRASRMAPRDADAMPLPSEETTPPVTKTNRVMMGHRRFIGLQAARSRPHATAPKPKGIVGIRREFRLPDRAGRDNYLAERRCIIPDA